MGHPWCVVGSRRWSRVVLRELVDLTEGKSPICALADNPSQTRIELAKHGLLGNVEVLDRRNLRGLPADSLVVVASSSYEHYADCRELLLRGFDVLCEKPMTMLKAQALEVVEAATRSDSLLMSANLYLFNSTCGAVRQRSISETPVSARIQWWDPRADRRHGEAKSYDSATPLLLDCFPHIWAICSSFSEERDVVVDSLRVSEGGAVVNFVVRFSAFEVEVELRRNADERRREVVLECQKGCYKYDLDTAESVESSIAKGRPRGRGPLGLLLVAASECASSRDFDERLSPEFALQSIALAEGLLDEYIDVQTDFLRGLALTRDCDPVAREYSVKEMRSIVSRVIPAIGESPHSLRKYQEIDQAIGEELLALISHAGHQKR